jgi:putative colanic acid biosynthesis UDP-glucose lipid carrier transferase
MGTMQTSGVKIIMLPRGLIKEYFQFLVILLNCFDALAVAGAGLAAYFYKFGNLHLPTSYAAALIITSLLTAIVFRFFALYGSIRANSLLNHIGKLLQALLVVLMLLTVLVFFTKTGALYSREWVICWTLTAIFFLFSFRLCLLLSLRLMRANGWNERRVIIIGTSELGAKLVNTIQHSLWTGFRIVAIFDDEAPSTTQAENKNIGGIAIAKTPEDLKQYLNSQHNSIDEVWLALPLHAEERVKEILYTLRHHAITARFALDIFGLDLLNYSITDFAGIPMLNIRSTPMIGSNQLIKAIEDRILASIILLLISPVFLLAAIAVKISSPGPVFYRQKRVSWNGKEFDMLKFRTMPVDAEAQTGPVWAKSGEKRATKIGAFLRRSSLDELPQFINVLLGDMSIVGPRPERAYFVDQFKDEIPRYMQKHMVKAGITGWAQVNGWRGNTSLQKRIEYDLYYIENWSFMFDLKIIFLTFLRGFVHKNAY